MGKRREKQSWRKCDCSRIFFDNLRKKDLEKCGKVLRLKSLSRHGSENVGKSRIGGNVMDFHFFFDDFRKKGPEKMSFRLKSLSRCDGKTEEKQSGRNVMNLRLECREKAELAEI